MSKRDVWIGVWVLGFAWVILFGERHAGLGGFVMGWLVASATVAILGLSVLAALTLLLGGQERQGLPPAIRR